MNTFLPFAIIGEPEQSASIQWPIIDSCGPILATQETVSRLSISTSGRAILFASTLELCGTAPD